MTSWCLASDSDFYDVQSKTRFWNQYGRKLPDSVARRNDRTSAPETHSVSRRNTYTTDGQTDKHKMPNSKTEIHARFVRGGQIRTLVIWCYAESDDLESATRVCRTFEKSIANQISGIKHDRKLRTYAGPVYDPEYYSRCFWGARRPTYESLLGNSNMNPISKY